MKKILFLSVFALGLMASCSEDELASTPSLNTNAIAFATQSANKATSRSGAAKVKARSGATINTIDKFTVSAVDENNTPFFSGVEFIYNGSTGLFHSATPYYWPTTGSLNFYAISDLGDVSLDDRNAPMYAYEDWDGETDLVAATVQAGEKTIPYPLVFQHVLSQVYVSAEAKDKEEQLTYKLTSVEMTTPCNGTYSFADATAGIGTWEIDNASSKEYSYADALPISFTETGNAHSGSTYWNILPVTDGKIQFKVGYQVLQNGKVIADFTGANVKTCEVENPNLLSGKRYVYNFLLTRGTGDIITFTTSIVDWDADSSITDLEPLDPALTYVTYLDGTTSVFDIVGVIEAEQSNFVSPSKMIDNLKNATYVKVGNKVTSLGYKAFAGCKSLARIDIPSSVQSLGDYAFAQCDALTELTLPEGITTLPKRLFSYQNGWHYGAEKLSKLHLPSTLTTIGEYAFAGCPSLKSIDIPASVTEIERYAFSESNVTNVKFNGPVHLGSGAFYGCNLMESISIPEGSVLESNCFMQNIGRNPNNSVGAERSTHMKEVSFEGKVTFNGYSQFYGCVNLEKVYYHSLELPGFGSAVMTASRNAWSSTTAEYAMGYNTRNAGTNLFCVPVNATYTEADLDVFEPVVFNPDYSGFTLSKSL